MPMRGTLSVCYVTKPAQCKRNLSCGRLAFFKYVQSSRKITIYVSTRHINGIILVQGFYYSGMGEKRQPQFISSKSTHSGISFLISGDGTNVNK